MFDQSVNNAYLLFLLLIISKATAKWDINYKGKFNKNGSPGWDNGFHWRSIFPAMHEDNSYLVSRHLVSLLGQLIWRECRLFHRSTNPSSGDTKYQGFEWTTSTSWRLLAYNLVSRDDASVLHNFSKCLVSHNT